MNAACDSLIRLVENGISRSIGDSILSFSELQTVVYEVANLLNSTPIGIIPGYDVELGVYICPNVLLLGHNNMGILSNDVSSKRDYFPTLIVRQKWHAERRNMKPGDIVIVQDSSPIRGRWRLAQVTKVE